MPEAHTSPGPSTTQPPVVADPAARPPVGGAGGRPDHGPAQRQGHDVDVEPWPNRRARAAEASERARSRRAQADTLIGRADAVLDQADRRLEATDRQLYRSAALLHGRGQAAEPTTSERPDGDSHRATSGSALASAERLPSGRQACGTIGDGSEDEQVNRGYLDIDIHDEVGEVEAPPGQVVAFEP